MLPIFKQSGMENPCNEKFQIWQQKNHAEEGFVELPEDYLYSSAKDYAGMIGPVNVSMIEFHILN